MPMHNLTHTCNAPFPMHHVTCAPVIDKQLLSRCWPLLGGSIVICQQQWLAAGEVSRTIGDLHC